MFIRFFICLNQYPRLIIFFVFGLSIFFFIKAKEGLFDKESGRLRINSTVEPFIERDSGAYKQFLEARNVFGSEEVVVIALKNLENKPISLDILLKLSTLQSEIKSKVPGVSKILTILDIPRASGECAGKSYFHKMGIGSVCYSVLEKYQHEISCLNDENKENFSSLESEDDLVDSLEDDIEDVAEDDLDSNGEIFSNDDTTSESFFSCNPEKSKINFQEIYSEAQLQISNIVKSLKSHPLFQGDLLSKNLTTTAIIISFNSGSKPESDKTQSILKSILENNKNSSENFDFLRIAYAGQPRQINKAAHLIQNDMKLILPLSILLIVVVLLVSFRSIKIVIIPVSVVLIGILWTAGIIGLIGDELNLVTMACAPIIICVGSAYVIKFLNQYQIESKIIIDSKQSDEHSDMALKKIFATLSSVSIPVTVTAITTVAGFIALVVSPIPAVQQLGLYSSVGIVSINLFTLTLVPALLNFIRIPEFISNENKIGFLNRLFEIIVECLRIYSKRLILIWILIASLSALGMFKLSINSSTNTFPENSSLVQDLKLIENELSGTDSLRLLFSSKNNDENNQVSLNNPLKTAKTIFGLRNLQEWLFQINETNEIGLISGLKIDKIHSPVDVLSHYRRGLEKLTDEEVIKFFEETNKNGPKFLSEEEDILQITIRMKTSGSTSFLELRDLLIKKIPKFLPYLQFSYTGGGILSSESANNIAQGQINSVILALVIVFVILSLLFLSWKMGVVALFPNVITILIFFGSLGWLDIPIGVTISVIAAIALGIGVDDTIHFLSHYNENANKLRNKREASLKTLPIVGRPMLFSTTALFASFILFVLSDMESIVLFGTFTALTLLACLAIDMTFLPSVVMETGLITVWDYVGLKFDEKFIEGIDLFQNMTVREAKIASLMAYTEDLPPGTLLFSEGEIGDEMYVILEGSISIFMQKNGNRTDLARLEKGNTFGEMGLFRNAERSASAESAEKTRLLVVNRDCLEPLKKRNPKIAAKLFLNLANRLQNSLKETDERLLNQKLFNLASLAKLTDGGDLDQKEILINPTQIWQNFGEKKRHKLLFFGEQYKVLRGKKLSKIKSKRGEYLFIISGEVEVESTASRKSEKFAVGYCWTRKEFDLIGEYILCSGGEASSAQAIARKDSILVQYTKNNLLILTDQEPRIASQFFENIVCILSDQLAIADKRLQGH